MIAVSSPRLRPETGLKAARYSQRQVDLIDLRRNEFATLPFNEVVTEADYPNLHLLISVLRDDGLYDPATRHLQATPRQMVLTFNNLISRTAFVAIIGGMLAELERVYGHPVDTEFTASIAEDGQVHVNLLQCRPMNIPEIPSQISVPTDIPVERVLFHCSHFIGGGIVEGIRHIIYVVPEQYAAIESPDVKKSIGRVIGQVNATLREMGSKELIVGPGRFGSSNINLGVNVSYADIDNAAALVEVAREEAGQLPELSYGTHFFQDLVESHTIYLAAYPDDPTTSFQQSFFEGAPNILADLAPEMSKFAAIVRVIDVSQATGGQLARLVADPQGRDALCYLALEA